MSELTFIRNVSKNKTNTLAEYQCDFCDKKVIRYKSNITKTKSCGCYKNITHGQSNSFLYRKYHFYKSKFVKSFKFRNFTRFKFWAIENGWDEGKTIIFKNNNIPLSERACKNNLLIMDKNEAREKVRKKSSELTDEQKKAIKVYSLKFFSMRETTTCKCNLIALILNLAFCDVYKHLLGKDIDNNLFDNRMSYKRAWRIHKNNFNSHK